MVDTMNEFPRKLTDDDWIGSYRSENVHRGTVEKTLCDRRDEVLLYGYVCDAEASYSFDDFALVSLDGLFYLLETRGCSCPSPEEMWSVVLGPVKLLEIEQHLHDERHREHAYGVTVRQFEEFLALVAAARRATAL